MIMMMTDENVLQLKKKNVPAEGVHQSKANPALNTISSSSPRSSRTVATNTCPSMDVNKPQRAAVCGGVRCSASPNWRSAAVVDGAAQVEHALEMTTVHLPDPPDFEPGEPDVNIHGGTESEWARYQQCGWWVFQLLLLLLLLYLFTCLLDLLAKSAILHDSETILKGKSPNWARLDTPVLVVSIGCFMASVLGNAGLATAWFTQFNTSVSTAILFVLGANFGTDLLTWLPVLNERFSSVPVTLVGGASGGVGRAQWTISGSDSAYGRVVRAACAHDLFGVLTVVIVLPVELISRRVSHTGQGFLEYVTCALLGNGGCRTKHRLNRFNILHGITRPFTDLIVKLNESQLLGWSPGTFNSGGTYIGHSGGYGSTLILRNCTQSNGGDHCHSLFGMTSLADRDAASILMFVTLFLISVIYRAPCCLLALIRRLIREPVWDRCQHALSVGHPSSSCSTERLVLAAVYAFTALMPFPGVIISLLMPMLGSCSVSLQRVYGLTSISCLGAFVTMLLFALCVEAPLQQRALQLALAQLLVSGCGLTIWLLLPGLHAAPLALVRWTGGVLSDHRWLLAAYGALYVLLPAAAVGAALLGPPALWTLASVAGLLAALVAVVLLLRRLRPAWLRRWRAVAPEPCRSLRPYDRVGYAVARVLCCCSSALKRPRRGPTTAQPPPVP